MPHDNEQSRILSPRQTIAGIKADEMATQNKKKNNEGELRE